jgi:hypothetical protein
MAIVGECCGWDEETVVLSRWQHHRDLLPLQPDRTRFNRRRRALTPAINLVRQGVLQVFDLAQDTAGIIDSLPIPVVQFYHVPQANTDWKAAGATFGHCCSKKPAIFGDNLPLLLTQSGVIRDCVLASANEPDLTVGVTLLESQTALQVLADNGSLSHAVAESLRARGGLDLLTIPRTNQRRQASAAFRHLHAHLRQLIATVNRQLALQFHVATNPAHRFWGLTARLATKLAAHTLCVWLTRLLGAPNVLHITHLAFPNN